MKDKKLDCVNYINNISKQKVAAERIFLYMKKNGESVTEEEIQKTIATLVSLNRLEEQGISTKSYLFPSLPDNVLAPQTQVMDEDEPNFSEMENAIIDEINTTVDNTQKGENLDSLLKDMNSFKEFRDSVESRLHRMEEAIIANSNVQKASLLSNNGIGASSSFVVDLLKERIVFLVNELKQRYRKNYLVMDAGVHPSLHAICHHQIVYAKFKLKIHYPPPYERKSWHFQKAEINLIKRAMNKFSWERAFFNLDINKMVSVCNTTIKNIIANFTPH